MTSSKLSRASWSDRIFDIVVYVILGIVTVITLYPFLNVLAISLNDSTDSVRGGITIFPRVFTLKNYETIFAFSGLITGLKISVLRTIVGTILGLISSAMLAFTISRMDFGELQPKDWALDGTGGGTDGRLTLSESG